MALSWNRRFYLNLAIAMAMKRYRSFRRSAQSVLPGGRYFVCGGKMRRNRRWTQIDADEEQTAKITACQYFICVHRRLSAVPFLALESCRETAEEDHQAAPRGRSERRHSLAGVVRALLAHRVPPLGEY